MQSISCVRCITPEAKCNGLQRPEYPFIVVISRRPFLFLSKGEVSGGQQGHVGGGAAAERYTTPWNDSNENNSTAGVCWKHVLYVLLGYTSFDKYCETTPRNVRNGLIPNALLGKSTLAALHSCSLLFLGGFGVTSQEIREIMNRRMAMKITATWVLLAT